MKILTLILALISFNLSAHDLYLCSNETTNQVIELTIENSGLGGAQSLMIRDVFSGETDTLFEGEYVFEQLIFVNLVNRAVYECERDTDVSL